ncbi:DUF2939 domain-containing protein [Phascolarctobacterium sp.]|uniref:DUF2939 domain-containing protein n=1 Tax=Phascolarctobacterium sp. TaxID=2049039 RepID=UPI002A80BA9F|nr:DUF2939 domain-containing protein [Phascolarctobacterium sp.]MDY5045527.1 DUF2939 domain-containing protein [Phascolarctobacterium sp.]
MSDNQKKIGIGVVAALLCCVAFYFLYWVKTPAYSLNIIREAIQKHDVTTFERHVDMDTLYPKAFDDFLVATDKIEGKNTLANPLAAGFIQMFKPPVVAALKAATIEGIKGEENNSTEKKDDAANMANNIKGRSGLDKSVFKDVSVISSEGDTSIVAIKLHNRKVDKDFDLKVKMKKLDDGKWRVKEITNLVDFIVEEHKAEVAKLAELDKPIKDKIYKAVKIDSTSGQIWSEGDWFPTWKAKGDIRLKNLTEKDIKAVKGYIQIRDKKNQVVKSSDLITSTPIKANTVGMLFAQMKINEYDDKEKVLTTTPAKEFHLAVKIMEVHYTDGTSLARPYALPDPDEKKSK